MIDRPQKITFGEMRDMGVRGLLIYCADYRCSHSIAISGDQWADDDFAAQGSGASSGLVTFRLSFPDVLDTSLSAFMRANPLSEDPQSTASNLSARPGRSTQKL
jgi:hypothetical protein